MTPARFPDGMELRAATELRAAPGRRLEGYAAVFGIPASLPGFSETVAPGAFRSSLVAGRDVVALVDHDPGRLLARTSSGTLRLQEDGRGLAFSIDTAPTTLGNDVLELVRRGDVGGCSFAFRVPPGGDHWSAKDRRELRAVELVEISIVLAWPAYAGTTVAARARVLGTPAVLARRRYLETV